MASDSLDDPTEGSAPDGELIPELEGGPSLLGHVLEAQGGLGALLERGWVGVANCSRPQGSVLG